MKINEYKKQIYNKVYTSTKVEALINLLSKLSYEIKTYTYAYRLLKFLREDDTNNSKRKDLERDIKYAKKEIESLRNQIEEFFNDGFFQELTKEQADDISSEYQHLVEIISYHNYTIKNDLKWQVFTNLIATYKNTINPIFERLNNNIEVYNSRANEEGWKYKLRSYDEAKEYFKQNLSVML